MSQLALPYLPTPERAIKQIIAFLQKYFSETIVQTYRLVDLGAGDGRVVHALAMAFPQWQVRGVEINKELSDTATKLVAGLPNAQIFRGDIFQEDLTGVDVVFLFALPTIMPNLRHTFAALGKDAIIITFQYPLNILGFSVKEIHKEIVQVSKYSYQFFVNSIESRACR
ncbi:MAG: hypothetical protein RBG13Loki_0580 [Promethearchaeota archaeon CR_4]|nr:MAG: hypothetical protein RBG13Loki_0580 [Candidatus Lokiarchaeota archaeon CR_4]